MPFVITPEPSNETFTGLLEERLAPFLTLDVDPEGAHQILLDAKAAMFEQLFALVWDQGDPDDPDYAAGWTSLFDVDACLLGYLPFLGQVVGVPPAALVGADDATARQIIRAEQGMQRGTLATVIAATQRFLTGTQSVAVEERTAADGTPDAYHFIVVVRPEEIIDLAGLTAAVNAVKPAGVFWTLIQADAPLLSQYTRLLSAVNVPLAAAVLADVT
jgi:hypothetical protein